MSDTDAMGYGPDMHDRYGMHAMESVEGVEDGRALAGVLTPAECGRLDHLALALTRGAVGGIGQAQVGAHRSVLPGHGVAFVDRRRYEPGDDPRRVDWRLLGRTDRLYVRRFERDSDLSVAMLLDNSSSMAFRGIDVPMSPVGHGSADPTEAPSKSDHARCLAAGIAYLAQRRRDRVSLSFTAGRPLAEGIARMTGSAHRHAALVVISDLIEPIASWHRAAAWAVGRGASVVLWQVLHPHEYRLPAHAPSGERPIVDPETHRAVRADLRGTADSYAQRMNRFIAARARATRQVGARHRLSFVGDDPIDALAGWLCAGRARGTSAAVTAGEDGTESPRSGLPR